MSGTVWCCCSAGRPGTFVTKTLATLARGGFTDSLWLIVPHGEQAVYDMAVAGKPVHCMVREAPRGLTKQRRFFRELMLPGTEIVFIDDDIEAIKIKTPTGLVHVRDVHRLADYMFQLMKWKGDDCLLAGVYPVANRLWMSPRTSTANAYIAGCFYFLINDERVPEPLDDELEDYGRQLKLQAAGYPTLRVNWIGVQTQYFKNAGGMQTLRTPERRKNAVMEMTMMYPTLVSRKIRRDGTPDLRFLQKTAYWEDASKIYPTGSLISSDESHHIGQQVLPSLPEVAAESPEPAAL
jgi:hypothetical protein